MSNTPFKISNFINELDKRGGPLSPTHFTVEIQLPSKIQTASKNRIISLFCDSTALPGIGLGTDDSTQPYGYGPTHRVVWGTVFADIPLEFIVDASGNSRNIITEWMNCITNFNTSTHVTEANPTGQPFFMSYQKEYATTMKIYSHDSTGKKVIEHTCYDVYPFRLSEIPLSNNAADSYIKQQVQFSVNRWSSKYLQLDDVLNNTVTDARSRISQFFKDGSQSQSIDFMANGVGSAYSQLFNNTPNVNPGDLTDRILAFTDGLLTNVITNPRRVDSLFNFNSLF